MLTLASAVVPSEAFAAPLLRGFGGPAGFGSNVLNRNDDQSSSEIDLLGAFPEGLRFFGGPYDQFWVNNNGNITFSGPVFNFTPTRFPIADRPMIAPYWADVDTRSTVGLANPNENLVYWHLEPGRLIVTWYEVGYFSNRNDLRMSFQLVITNTLECGSGDFDVEFRYDRCEWTTGNASGGTDGFGGTPAQAGFDAGNLEDFVELPGSFTMDVLNLCTTSNVGVPGIWQFAVRSGGVVCPDAGMPCQIEGALGACAEGRTQCVGREIVCQPVTTPSEERCDNIDNDCDGVVDEQGDEALCVPTHVCSLGACVPRCFEGGCDPDYTCQEATGVCIEDACLEVECESGQRCIGGVCLDACEGVVCPHAQVCISGECVDPCASVTCDADQSCRDGICVPHCPCVPCPSGQTCGADGQCRERGCDIVTCPDGAYCSGGRCYDSCEGVVCPLGQTCQDGNCTSRPVMRDAGMPDGGELDGDAGMEEPMDAGVDAGADAGRMVREPDEGGCGCRVQPTGGVPAGWAGAMAGLVGLLVIRRRRRR
ncbi:MAG: hypothetical protein KF901_05075 [Myxococcales bacterium]|nr:hypothetical protein [Myxococcales bacterium]